MVQYHVHVNEQCALNRNRHFKRGPGLKYMEQAGDE